MTLPLTLPITPMLAKAVDELPVGQRWGYEPKWDGFRCIVSRDGDEITLGSRSSKPLTRYFPEIVETLRSRLPAGFVVDGELVVRQGTPGAEHLAWEAISARIHPEQSRIQRLATETPAELVCFDLLVADGLDLTAQPFARRREQLERLFDSMPVGLHLSAMTTDPRLAQQWFHDFEGAGLDGVIAKGLDSPYTTGKRTMLKIKHKRTAEAVVYGYRVHKSGRGVGSLLLGMYDGQEQLIQVGGIGALSDAMREALQAELAPLVLRDEQGRTQSASRPRSRFSSAEDAAFVPLAPSLVVEVAFDQLEGRRFRHAATLVRFRPDRDPQSCLIDQVDRPVRYDLARVLQQ